MNTGDHESDAGVDGTIESVAEAACPTCRGTGFRFRVLAPLIITAIGCVPLLIWYYLCNLPSEGGQSAGRSGVMLLVVSLVLFGAAWRSRLAPCECSVSESDDAADLSRSPRE